MNAIHAVEANILNGGLLINFSNGEVRFLSLEPFLKGKIFKPLYDIKKLSDFKIINGAVEWSCGPSLCSDTIYFRSVDVSELTCKSKAITA